MRIRLSDYPVEIAKPFDYVSFKAGAEVNRVLLYRFAAYCRDIVKKKTVVAVGFRSYDEQARLYDLWRAGKGNLAAKPGESAHNYGLAIDVQNIGTKAGIKQYPGTINSDYDKWKTGIPSVLNKYGLTHSVSGEPEPWHIVPIELTRSGQSKLDYGFFIDDDDFVNTTTGYPVIKKSSPVMRGNFVVYLQSQLNLQINAKLEVDGLAGNNTISAIKEYQAKKGLSVDGSCGQQTWSEIVKYQVIDYRLMYEKAQADIKALNAKITDLKTQIANSDVVHAALLKADSNKKLEIELLKGKITKAVEVLK